MDSMEPQTLSPLPPAKISRPPQIHTHLPTHHHHHHHHHHNLLYLCPCCCHHHHHAPAVIHHHPFPHLHLQLHHHQPLPLPLPLPPAINLSPQVVPDGQDQATAITATGLEQQEGLEENLELEEEEEEGDVVFVMTDEWKEFFAKSEAKRRLKKQQSKKGGK